MKLIKTIIIENPPTKYVHRAKFKVDEKTGKLKEKTYYLTGNLFLNNQNYFIISKILKDTKAFLYPYFKELPKIELIRFEFIYCKKDDNFDLDNKGYFWQKCIADLIKTPTNRQLINARNKNKNIISTNTIKDDTVKYLKGFSWEFKKENNHRLIIKVFGTLEEEKIDLFNQK